MLMPKREKFRRQHRGRSRGKAWRGQMVSFGEYGMKAVTCGWISSRQIEAARVALTRHMKRQGKVWIRIFPHRSLTEHSAETRMGGGKGAPSEHVALVKPGTIMFEVDGVTEAVAREAMRLAGHKLPVQIHFVYRDRKGVPE